MTLISIAGLALVSFVAGIGITALGPGGVLVTIGLLAFTPLEPGQVAGTAMVTNIGTGILGSVVYLVSGQLREPLTRKTALLLAGTAVIGTPIGVWLNSLVSKDVFSVLLGLFVASIGVLVWYREHRRPHQQFSAEENRPNTHIGLIIAVGICVATASGVFGVGGPVLSVPLLIALGTPVLTALAAAQFESIVIATVGTIGYFTQSEISWHLALIVGTPKLAGVLVGWKVARSVPTRGLKNALVATLVILAPYLALRGITKM